MAVCALTDFFVGSPFSTFTGVIAAQRERVQLKDPSHRPQAGLCPRPTFSP
jgi:hypothetical protein